MFVPPTRGFGNTLSNLSRQQCGSASDVPIILASVLCSILALYHAFVLTSTKESTLHVVFGALGVQSPCGNDRRSSTRDVIALYNEQLASWTIEKSPLLAACGLAWGKNPRCLPETVCQKAEAGWLIPPLPLLTRLVRRYNSFLQAGASQKADNADVLGTNVTMLFQNGTQLKRADANHKKADRVIAEVSHYHLLLRAHARRPQLTTRDTGTEELYAFDLE